MAQIISVRLARNDNAPWGFRLQGGKDFGVPLVIQKVNGGSPAEKAGLIAGDSVIKVNNTDVFNLRHKDAQDVIVRAGPSFEITIQRGGSTWKPQVTPTGSLPRAGTNSVSPVTKTSLAAKPQSYSPIGATHNVSAKAFSPNAAQMNGSSDGPRLVNKQFNSPIGLYSEESIAETLSAQAEVLSTGALGVNFKKNEKTYNAANSEVLKMLHETESEPHSEPVGEHLVSGYRPHVTSPRPLTPVPQQKISQAQEAQANARDQDTPVCTDCQRVIVGVFVRIKDKNLHVECFKCSTCGTSLKNVGYYNINHKLYCDIHAKLAAKSNAPGPNMVPVTVPPGSKAPAGAISAALASHSLPTHSMPSHSLPSPSPLSPTGNQYAAPYQPVDVVDSAPQPKKEEAISNLISALTVAKVKQMKDSSTNTNGTYVTEAHIPINNNNYTDGNANNDLYATVNKIKYAAKTGSSLSGPKPFSSMAPSHPIAPVSAPKPAPPAPVANHSMTMPGRKEWPPTKEDDLPTATPLYIPPMMSSPKTFSPMSQNLEQTTYVQTNFVPIESVMKSTEEFNESHADLSQVSKSAFAHKMSICSSEVTNITEQRSVIDTLADSIETQMLVHSLATDRPETPPPIENDIIALPVFQIEDTTQSQIEEMPCCGNCNPGKCKNCCKKSASAVQCPLEQQQCPLYQQPQIIQQNPREISQSMTSKKTYESSQEKSHETMKSNKYSTETIIKNPVPQQWISPMVKALTIASDRPFNAVSIDIETLERNPANLSETKVSKLSAVVETEDYIKEKAMKESQMAEVCAAQMYSSKADESQIKGAQMSSLQKDVTQTQSTKMDSHMRSGCSQMDASQLSASQMNASQMNASQRSASEMSASQMSASQLSASQRSASQMSASQVSSSQMNSLMSSQYQKSSEMKSSESYDQAFEQKTESTDIKFPHEKPGARMRTSMFTKALTIAPDQPFSPVPKITMDHVPLPPETEPYIPKEIPFTIEPKINPQHVEPCKSPFIEALTTAPARSYSPFVPEQSDDSDFMKDVPQPTKQTVTMLSALTVATDRPFTPVLFGQEQPVMQIVEPPKPVPPRPVPKRVEPPKRKIFSPLPSKPASHISPSAFKPLGTSQFVPVSETYKPQQPEYVPQAFPPVSNDLTSSFSKVRSYMPPPPRIRIENQIPTQTAYSKEYTQEQQIQRKEMTRQAIHTTVGLHAPTSLPEYQKNITVSNGFAPGVPTYDQYQQARMQQPKPIQKPVTTLQPGQYQPNIPHTSFQPVVEEHDGYHGIVSHPPPRSVSPSMISHPAPSIPHYQQNLVASEHLAVESLLFDPASPAASRTPSPVFGRSASPYDQPHQRAKSPAQGPPPNPLESRNRERRAQRDPRYAEAKENIQTYIPKYQGYQGRVDQIKKQSFSGESGMKPVPGHNRGDSGYDVQQYHTQFADQQQYGNQMVKISGQEDMKHTQAFNKSESKSVQRTSGAQIQRTKKCTEEFERTQKMKTIEIERSSTGATHVRTNVGSGGNFQKYETTVPKPITQYPTQPIQPGPAPTYHRTTRTPPQSPVSKFQKGPTPFGSSQARSYSLPGPSIAPKTKPVSVSPMARDVPSKYQSSPLARPVYQTSPQSPSPIKPSKPNPESQFKPVYQPNASLSNKPSASASSSNVSQPNVGSGGKQAGAIGISPRRGRGILNVAAGPGSRVPLCAHCNSQIRGPFITALGKIWCPEHFICTTPNCRRPLQDLGFVEEKGQLYCEYCFEQYIAPPCSKCNSKIKGDCLNAIGKHFHPECFLCAYCGKLFGNTPFFLEDGLPYCEADWNELFTTKCFACGFPVEAGDRWVEALNNNYHSQCFNCTMCKKNLEGQSFFAKGGRPFCKNHAR